MATLLNFIPYAGPILAAGAILLAAVATFSTPLEVFYPPLAFVLLTALEGNFITPMLLGRRLTLNPVLLFASRSEEHTSELQSLMRISYAVFCLTTNTKYHPPSVIPHHTHT